MKPKWALQGSAINDDDSKGMIEAITSLGCFIEEIKINPFCYDSIPDIFHDGPIIPYGGTKMIDAIIKTKKWKCWFNENFNYQTYVARYGKAMFNSDANFMKMKDFCPSNYKGQEYLFIRPNKDLKEFSGGVITLSDFIEWYKRLCNRGFEVNEETEIVVSRASKIDDEWRMFVVNKEVVSGSFYKKNYYLSQDPNVPERVYSFVKEMVEVWTPSDVFVMDVCSLKGDLYILELGDFHSAGWYMSDKKKIIRSVSEFAMV